MNIANNKKTILLGILIIVFALVIIFGVSFFYLNRNRNKNKTNDKKYYLNIDENKVIENPTTNDIKNLIDQIETQGI
ncbi:MAG TPA: hypothetical protein PLD95_01480 [bacterium]|jgi:uncharacterized protein YxeA|nr:hypothetical protein [bacterium]HOG38119.1 hypothetical protein [bacterium]HQI03175.1 hypothetical protein [bacterium]